MNIFLMGYMGSGKSTIGKILAQELQLDFVDFDHYLEQKENKTIKEIFASKGEIYFRKLETAVLKELLHNQKDAVISLGGGTPCYANNMEMIKKAAGQSVYIKVGVEELADRLWKARAHRPLLLHQDTPEKLEEYIRKHLFERGFYYNQADFVLKVEDESAAEIAQMIKSRIG